MTLRIVWKLQMEDLAVAWKVIDLKSRKIEPIFLICKQEGDAQCKNAFCVIFKLQTSMSVWEHSRREEMS